MTGLAAAAEFTDRFEDVLGVRRGVPAQVRAADHDRRYELVRVLVADLGRLQPLTFLTELTPGGADRVRVAVADRGRRAVLAVQTLPAGADRDRGWENAAWANPEVPAEVDHLLRVANRLHALPGDLDLDALVALLTRALADTVPGADDE